MAAEWGGLSLATLLNHGLLDKIKMIGSISAEATASAVLRKTLEVGLSPYEKNGIPDFAGFLLQL